MSNTDGSPDPEVSVEFDPSEPVIIKPQRSRAFLLALAALGFLLVGLVMAVAAEDITARVMGVVCGAFGAFGAWKLFGVAFGNGGGVRLDADGLHADGHPTLSWGEITEFSHLEIEGQPMLGIHVADEEALIERFPMRTRMLARANQGIAGTPYTLAAKNYGIAVPELAALVAGYQQLHTGQAEEQ